MMPKQQLSTEQKKQVLLDRFLPYQQQDVNCRRIVAYLHSSHATDEVIERMRSRWEHIRQERVQQYTRKVQHIRVSAEEQSRRDREEAEQLLLSW